MSSTPHRVLFVGGEDIRLRIPFFLHLENQGYVVHVAGSGDSGPFQSHPIEYHKYSLPDGPNIPRMAKAFFELIALFKSVKPDLIHSFDTFPGIIVPIAARCAGTFRVVRTITGRGRLFALNRKQRGLGCACYRVLQRIASTLAHTTVFQNRDDQEYFQRHNIVSGANSSLIRGSGIDVDGLRNGMLDTSDASALRMSLGGENRVIFLLLGRLMPTKGVREYIQASRLVYQKGIDCLFLLAGPYDNSGGDRITPEEISAAGPQLRYLGSVSKVAELLSAVDVLVLPTFYGEGIPRVLLEAGAAGLPLIATPAPGCRDVIEHNYNGLIVPAGNIHHLAAAIEDLAASREKRELFGSRSLDRVRSLFTMKMVVSAHIDLYKELGVSATMGEACVVDHERPRDPKI